MDHVDEDGPTAGFAAPGRAVEVVIRFREHGRAGDRDELSQGTVGDQPPGRCQQGAVPPVVTDEKRHSGRLGGIDELSAVVDGLGDRFLDQCGNAHRDALQTLRDVEVVRCRDHPDAFERFAGEKVREAGVEGNSGLPRDLFSGDRRIHHGQQVAVLAVLDQLDVAATDQTGPGHDDTRAGHDAPFPVAVCACRPRIAIEYPATPNPMTIPAATGET